MKTFVLWDQPNAERLWAYLKSEWRKGAAINRPLSVTVQSYSDKRTGPQNRQLHAMLDEISEQVWVGGRQVESRVWKVYFKEKFLPLHEVLMPDGEIRQEAISTADLTVQEFSEFIEKIAAHAATEFGLEPIAKGEPA